MSYPGFCVKYGEDKMMLLVYSAPPILNAAFLIASSASVERALVTSVIAFCAGFGGLCTAVIAHEISDSILSRRGVGLTRGANITKWVQAAAYSLPVSLALIFNVVSVPDQKDIEVTNSNVDRIENMEAASTLQITELQLRDVPPAFILNNPLPMPILPQ